MQIQTIIKAGMEIAEQILICNNYHGADIYYIILIIYYEHFFLSSRSPASESPNRSQRTVARSGWQQRSGTERRARASNLEHYGCYMTSAVLWFCINKTKDQHHSISTISHELIYLPIFKRVYQTSKYLRGNVHYGDRNDRSAEQPSAQQYLIAQQFLWQSQIQRRTGRSDRAALASGTPWAKALVVLTPASSLTRMGTAHNIHA